MANQSIATTVEALLPSHSVCAGSSPLAGPDQSFGGRTGTFTGTGSWNVTRETVLLTLGIFAWFMTHSAVSSILASHTDGIVTSSSALLLSPWPYTLSCVHFASLAAALHFFSHHPAALHSPVTSPVLEAPCTTHQTWSHVYGPGVVAVAVMAFAFAFAGLDLPQTTLGTLLVACICLTCAITSSQWLVSSRANAPAALSICALFLAAYVHNTDFFTISCLLLALTIAIYLTCSTLPALMAGPSVCRALSLQFALAGALIMVVAFVHACSRGLDWTLASPPCSAPVLLLVLAANSAALVHLLVTSASALSEASLSAAAARGISLALVSWLVREITSGGVGGTASTHGLSALAVGMSVWCVTRLTWLHSCIDRGHNQVHGSPLGDYEELNMVNYSGDGGCADANDLTARRPAIRTLLMTTCLFVAAAVHLTFFFPGGGPIPESEGQALEDQVPAINALVTGGAGFVGSHFIRLLLATQPSSRVTVLDNLSTAGIHTIAPLIHKYGRERVAFVLGDVANATLVRDVMRRAQPNAVIHLVAPKMAVTGECDATCRSTLVNGTQSVVDATTTLDAIPRVILASSSDVYGPIPSMLKPVSAKFSEQDPLHAVTPMASAMMAAEQIVSTHARLFSTTSLILRLFPIVGPTAVPEPAMNTNLRRWTGAGIGLPAQIEDSSERQRLTDVAVVDWVHISDVGQALLRATTAELDRADSDMGIVRVINIGSGVCGVTATTSPCTRADISIATKLIGYRPTVFHAGSKDPLVDLAEASGAGLRNHPEFDLLVSSLATSPWLLPRNLLRSTFAPLTYNLTALAHAVAQHRSPAQHAKAITIVPFQKGYRAMVENAVYSLMTWGNVRNLLLFAIDAASADECLYLNMPCYNATALATADFTNRDTLDPKYKDKIWSVISWVKPRVVKALLELGFSVNLSDADIGFLRDVWQSYEEYMSEVGADMSITSEISDGFEANTGNYVVRPTPQSLRFYEQYLAIGESDPTISDQHAWAKVFRNNTMHFCASPAGCASERAQGRMPVREYSPLFGRHSLCPHPIDVCKPDMLYVHPICIAGRENKIRSLKSFGAWFITGKSPQYYCDEKVAFGGAECPGLPAALEKGYINGMEEEWKKEWGMWCLGGVAKLTDAEDN